MAKKIHFALLFSVFFCFLTVSRAENRSEDSNKKTTNLGQCDAPAPDSFRITSVSYNYINLAWEPVWSGATHTLRVLTRVDSSSPWIPVDSFLNVPGSSFAVPNEQYDLQKTSFMIHTNCPNGEPGVDFRIIQPPISLILDLTIGGLMPSSPTPLPLCQPVKLEDGKWVGFEVRKIEMGLNPPRNTFEVDYDGTIIVKRVLENNLVAGDKWHDYPKNPPFDHVKISESFFKVFIVTESDYLNIGFVNIEHTSVGADEFLTICKNLDAGVWNDAYALRVLTYMQPKGSNGFGRPISERRNNLQRIPVEIITVQSPFNDFLNIFFPDNYFEEKLFRYEIHSLNGSLITGGQIDKIDSVNSIATDFLPSGVYFLRLSSEQHSTTFKIIK